ncbi:ABC transporter ATP-binding protein [Enhygromyxa salina]|uniref:Putative ABC transporter ATP-binding protein n=1 Tax=Enhygromyxa salina TaxID=215803 RepID=A0A2S9YUK9_9BACT|nr:ATP-binding cassette domain-containing protein [Enhygromyxa salina]PRQ08729.1 putative ABC transporter ATP-binding protein [Enhygromyxa salina]
MADAAVRKREQLPRLPTRGDAIDLAAGREVVLEARDLDMAFGPKQIFKGLNLKVYEGEVLVIIGFSGSGKSVLLKLLSGLLEPDQGEVFYRGRDLSEMDDQALVEMRKSMSHVFQSNALFDSINVLENVGYGLLEHTKMSDAQIRARVTECLAWVGLGEEVLMRMPAQLSGGMQKRVGLARAVATEPNTILYDDPTGGLDPISVTRIGDMIEHLQAELHLTSVMVSGDMKIVFRVADRVALLHRGHIAHLGTPDYFRECDAPEVIEFVRDPEGRAVRY